MIVQTHVVGIGDTWWKIAKAYHVCLQDLLEANSRAGQNKSLPVGETVQIPEPKEVMAIESENETKEKLVPSLSPPVYSKVKAWGELGNYIVRPGDTWATIAENFYLTIAHLKAANPHLIELNWLPAGQSINIPSIGVILKEYATKKQSNQAPQQSSHAHQSYTASAASPAPYYLGQYGYGLPPYPIYRCNCEYCRQLQDQNRTADKDLESSSQQESSSFWGSSSYFESSSMGWESSSSWLRDSGEDD